jgi:hypothetical protein
MDSEVRDATQAIFKAMGSMEQWLLRQQHSAHWGTQEGSKKIELGKITPLSFYIRAKITILAFVTIFIHVHLLQI